MNSLKPNPQGDPTLVVFPYFLDHLKALAHESKRRLVPLPIDTSLGLEQNMTYEIFVDSFMLLIHHFQPLNLFLNCTNP